MYHVSLLVAGGVLAVAGAWAGWCVGQRLAYELSVAYGKRVYETP